MRGRLLLVAAILALAAAPGVARADCAGPAIAVTDVAVGPGEPLRVLGDGFASDCADSGVGAFGCSFTPTADPERGIVLELADERGVLATATVDADAEYRFAVDLPLPDDLEPGSYSLTAVAPNWGPTEPVEVVVSGG